MTAILALLLVTAATTPAEGTVVQVVEHYAIEVPAGYVLKDVSPKRMDFDLYVLADKRTDSVKCTLYVGNHPGFPRLRWSGKPIEASQGGGTRKEFRTSDRIEGLLTFRDLTYQGSRGSPFERVHYYADRLSAAEMKVVTAMVASIIIAKKDLK